jgi:CheY-like chemotaxis protein
LSPPRVLVIEDDPGVLEVLRSVLEAEGYQVLSACSVVHPQDVSQLRPALVILDIWLDGKARGWDLLQTLRETPGARHIPVLVCTADVALARCEDNRFRELAADVLLKPFDLDDFVTRVAVACRPSPASCRAHKGGERQGAGDTPAPSLGAA